MIEYILFYFIVSIGMILSLQNFKGRTTSNFYFFFLSLIFLLFIGFRCSGYDYTSYENIFNNIKSGDEIIGVEYGFISLCNFSNTFRQLIFLMALLTVVSHMFFIYKTSENSLFSVFLLSATFLLPTFMGQMRQGLALGFVAISLYHYINKNFKWALVTFIFAFLFHFSSLLALLFLLVPKQVKSFKYYLFVVLLSIVAFQFFQPLFFKFINMFPNLVYFDKLLGYSENDDLKLGFNSAIIIRIFVLFIGYYYRNLIANKYFPTMLNIYMLSIVIYLTIGPIIPALGGRGSLYFSYFDIILIPTIINAAIGPKKIILIFIFILLTYLRLIQFFKDDFNYSTYVPYLMYLK